MKKIVKRILGVSFVLTAFSFGIISDALAQSCAVAPTCESLGYTKSAADCANTPSLKCPFDVSKLYCTTYNDLDPLAEGDVVYSDFTTSRPYQYQSNKINGKNAIGVVVNAEKKLALRFGMQQPKFPITYKCFDGYGCDLEEISNSKLKEINEKLLQACSKDTGLIRFTKYGEIDNDVEVNPEIAQKLPLDNFYKGDFLPTRQDMKISTETLKQSFSTVGYSFDSEAFNYIYEPSCATVTLPDDYDPELSAIIGNRTVIFTYFDRPGKDIWLHKYNSNYRSNRFAPVFFKF